MAFWRTRTVKKNGKSYRYEELLESYRVPGLKYPKHRIIKRRSKLFTEKEYGVGPTLKFTVGLPVMMAYDVISGQRVNALKEHLARKGGNAPTTPWGNEEWTRRVSLMSREEWDKYVRQAKAVRSQHSEWSVSQREKAARLGYLSDVYAREKEGRKVGRMWDDAGGGSEHVKPVREPSRESPTAADEAAEADRKSYYHQTIETQLWPQEAKEPKK